MSRYIHDYAKGKDFLNGGCSQVAPSRFACFFSDCLEEAGARNGKDDVWMGQQRKSRTHNARPEVVSAIPVF